MKLRTKRRDSHVTQVHFLPLPRPVRLLDGTTEIAIVSPDGHATLSLSRTEVEELIRYLTPPRT